MPQPTSPEAPHLRVEGHCPGQEVDVANTVRDPRIRLRQVRVDRQDHAQGDAGGEKQEEAEQLGLGPLRFHSTMLPGQSRRRIREAAPAWAGHMDLYSNTEDVLSRAYPIRATEHPYLQENQQALPGCCSRLLALDRPKPIVGRVLIIIHARPFVKELARIQLGQAPRARSTGRAHRRGPVRGQGCSPKARSVSKDRFSGTMKMNVESFCQILMF